MGTASTCHFNLLLLEIFRMAEEFGLEAVACTIDVKDTAHQMARDGALCQLCIIFYKYI